MRIGIFCIVKKQETNGDKEQNKRVEQLKNAYLYVVIDVEDKIVFA